MGNPCVPFPGKAAAGGGGKIAAICKTGQERGYHRAPDGGADLPGRDGQLIEGHAHYLRMADFGEPPMRHSWTGRVSGFFFFQ